MEAATSNSNRVACTPHPPAPKKTSEPSRIILAHRTALACARSMESAESGTLVRQAMQPPPSIPKDREIARLLSEAECSHPGFHVELPVHLLTSVGTSRRPTRTRIVLRHAGALPSSSVRRLDRNVLMVAPELALVQIAAQERDPIRLLMMLWEACGTYRTAATSYQPAQQIPAATNLRKMKRYVERNRSLHGAHKILTLLRYLADDSASVRETQCALLLGMPTMHGGYGLGIPVMNMRVDATKEARSIAGRSFFRCDLCWPKAKIDVEYQSDEEHEGKAMRIRDSRRANALASMGWTVIGITNDEAGSVSAIGSIAETIRLRLGKRKNTHVFDHYGRMRTLRRKLGLPARR